MLIGWLLRRISLEGPTPRSGWPGIEELWERFKADQEKLMAGSDRTKLVNKVRNNVYENCLKASASARVLSTNCSTGVKDQEQPGLCVAALHNSRTARVVIAIPYTSIIDQTAEVCRKILGHDAVLEHHRRLTMIR